MTEQRHWLYRPENRYKLWIVLIVVVLLTLLPEFFLDHHPHVDGTYFQLDASWGFFGWYGFLSCAGMVALAKILGIFLKRKETYYDE